MGAIDVEIPVAPALGKRWREMGIDEKDIQIVEASSNSNNVHPLGFFLISSETQ
jgi:hypothetical protein